MNADKAREMTRKGEEAKYIRVLTEVYGAISSATERGDYKEDITTALKGALFKQLINQLLLHGYIVEFETINTKETLIHISWETEK